MGRPPRVFLAGETYHLYSRGSNRQALFQFDSDRIDFLECLTRVARRHRLACVGYCLMPNHFHLIVHTAHGDLSDAMKALNGRYSLRFNRRYRRDAHLFKNRFGAVHQSSEPQLLWTLRYAVHNPVRARLCADPSEWPWSSYRASVGEDTPPPFLALGRLWSYFGDPPDLARARFREFVTSVDGACSV